MLRIAFIFLFFGLTGCASTQNQSITSKKVGVLIPESHNNKFCYLYKGVTVFNNESEQEQLKPNFSESYSFFVNKGIKKSGNVPVLLGGLKVENIQNYFQRSEWDHKITLTDSGRQFINQLLNSTPVDYILLPWLYDLDRCMLAATLGYSDLEYDLDANIQLHLLNAQNLQHMQFRQVNSINSTRPPFIPKEKAKPTEFEKEKLSENLYIELEDDAFRLLEGDCCYYKRSDIPEGV